MDSTSVDNLVAASKSADLDPKTAIALAHVSSDPSITVENAQAIAMTAKSARMANALSDIPTEAKTYVEARLPTATLDSKVVSRMTAATGYTPGPAGNLVDNPGRKLFPTASEVAAESAPSGGLFHDVLGQLDRARHDVAAAVNPEANLKGLEKGPGETRHILGDVLRPVGAIIPSPGRSLTHNVLASVNSAMSVFPHAYRTLTYLDELDDPKFGQNSFLVNLGDAIKHFGPQTQGKYSLSLKNLSMAWRATENGATTFDPNAVAAIKAKYSPEAYSVIHAVADGGDPAQIAEEYGPTVGPEILKAVELPEFKQAVSVLQNSRISIGREAVGENFLNNHPEEAHAMSGAIDALVDWYANPIVLGGVLRDASALSRYSLDANDVQSMYLQGGRVQRAMDYMAKSVNEGGADGLLRNFPEVAPLYEDLKPIIKHASEQGRPLEGKDIARWLSTQQGLVAMTAGRSGRFFHGEVMAPHISALNLAYRQGRVALGKTIDWAADDLPTIVKKLAPGYEANAEREVSMAPHFTMNAAARVRRMGKLVPTTNALVDGDATAIANFRRYANMFLPAKTAGDFTNLFADADAAGKYKAIRSLSASIFDAMGRADNPDLDAFAEAWLSNADNEFKNGQHYLSGGNDRFGSGANAMPVGLTLQDMSTVWRLPDWREIDKLSKKTAALGALRIRAGAIGDEAMRLWRVGVLMRPGFAERAGGEELAGKIARNGLQPLVRTYAARTATDVMNHVIDAIPGDVLPTLKTPDELKGAWYYFTRLKPIKATGALARQTGIAKSLAGEDRMASMKLFSTYGNGRDAFDRWASSIHQSAAGYGDSMDALTRMTTEGQGATGVELRAGRGYTIVGPSDPYFHERWAMRVNYLRNDPLSSAVMETADEGVAAQRQAVLALLKENSPYMRDLRRLNPRAKGLPDGRTVGRGITQSAADRDWADKIVQQVNEDILSPTSQKPIVLDKRTGYTLPQRLLANPINDSSILHGIPRSDVPVGVLGPQVEAYATNWFEKLLSAGMENFVGKPMDWLSRQPIFLDNYHMGVMAARRQLSRFYDGPQTITDAAGVTRELTDAEKTEAFDKLVSDVATERAVNETLPYVHDVRSRTQFEVVHRRTAPFLFAQRQFYARWMRNFVHSPEAIARISTIMNGLRVSGFVHNDPQTGEAYFVYPGSGTLNDIVTRTLNHLGVPAYMNVPSSFTGEVSALIPGLTGVVPGASPFISMPLNVLSTMFPGVQDFRTFADLGSQDTFDPNAGVAGNALNSFLPSFVTRVVSALGADEEGRAEVATQIINAMAYLSATGHGLPENASLSQRNVYVSRLKEQAQSMLVLKAALGFAVPAAPTLNTDSLGLDNEMLKLLNKLPYDQAIAAFIQADPDGLPYTIGKTGSISGAQLPTTSKGLQYMNEHLGFLKSYPAAAPWLIPQSVGTGPYDQAAEDEQLLTGLRQQRQPVADQPLLSSWYDELVYSQDGATYFNSEQAYEKALSNPGDTYAYTDTLKTAWDKWRAAYLATHPALQQVINSQIPTQRRTEVMTEMEQALEDPQLPKSPTTTAIKGLIDGFHTYQDAVSQYSADGNTLPGEGSNLWNLTNSFVAWGTKYAADNPEAVAFWQGILEDQVSW